ncbi:hypothetical protein ABXX67_004733 [Vibrio parahaemolyticus]|nr:hypothetical protein [Vibrio parahaemolyticus]ELY3379490.1 hypothetical protein [Vibrio parahaemolyticus]MBM5046079.1 hypothetical protein [Vibrio parahaemolyticus]
MILAKVTRIQAGQYSVDDGRFIVKQGSGWLVLTANGSHDFGPVPTLASAKQYVESETTPLGQHNLSTKHGRRQSKKAFNSYLASEVKNGNPMPAILWFIVLFIVCGVAFAVRGH